MNTIVAEASVARCLRCRLALELASGVEGDLAELWRPIAEAQSPTEQWARSLEAVEAEARRQPVARQLAFPTCS